jgi:tRNA threonylcarbamoyladenosine biosynthesis protein TsaE
VSWRREARDADATKRAGESFARLLQPGDIVLLIGQLGAGKTTFTQGVGQGLGVSDRITSPTFTMVRQHEAANDLGITTLHHADVYRIGSLDEVIDLALGELVEESAVALVEWGDIATSVFGREVMTVTFHLHDDDARTLVVDGDLTDHRRDALDAWAAE